MIKALGIGGDGRPVVILGLSSGNVTRIMAHEPIKVDLQELGLPPCTVVIVGGRTEKDITAELESYALLPPGTAERMGNPEPGQAKKYQRKTTDG